jgi:hypothetical protein
MTDRPLGAEMEVASDSGAYYGGAILQEICKLGFINRGINRPNLAITRETNMTAILLEPFFCDSSADVALYNPNTLGVAIAKGVCSILGGTVEDDNTITKKEEEQEMEKKGIAILYGNEVDQRAAEYLADAMPGSMPMDARRPFYYDMFEQVIGVGGTPTCNGNTGWSSYVTKIITGDGRNDTMKMVLAFIDNGCK